MRTLRQSPGVSRLRQMVREQFNSIGSRYLRSITTAGDDLHQDLSWLPELTNLRVLDVACGPGSHSAALYRQSNRVVSLDLAENMLRFARQHNGISPAASQLVQGDAAQLPFAAGAFDACFCAFSFALFPDPRQVIAEMIRVLRPEGFIVILDILAPEDARQENLLNRLEKFRANCYTRISALHDFLKVISTLPIRPELLLTDARAISFNQWVTASHFQWGTDAYRSARRLFHETVKAQTRLRRSHDPGEPRYTYLVARLLLRKVC